MVIIDEMAYIDQGLWDETIRALLNMRNAGLIGITTPRGPDNFVSKLFNMVNDDGSPFFNVLHMAAICEECLKLPTLNERVQCNHGWIPTYKSQAKQSRNAKIANATNSAGITAQEDQGLIVDFDPNKIFRKETLDVVFNLNDPLRKFDERLAATFTPERIYVMVDPNADGASYTAMISCFVVPAETLVTASYDGLVILGVDAMQTKGKEKSEMLLRHYKTIRNMHRYTEVPIVFVIENNSNSFAEVTASDLSKMPGAAVLREKGPESKVGIRKDETVTGLYASITERTMDQGRIYWHPEVFTASVDLANQLASVDNSSKSKIELVIAELKMQLMRVRYEKSKTAIYGKSKITGKTDIFQDDLAVTFMMACFWTTEVENKRNTNFDYIRSLEYIPIQQAQDPYGRSYQVYHQQW